MPCCPWPGPRPCAPEASPIAAPLRVRIEPYVLPILGVGLGVEAFRRLATSRSFDLDGLGDFLINLSFSRQVLSTGQYPEHFYYPPPFVLANGIVDLLGLPLAGSLWLAGIALATLACALLCLDLLGLREDPRRPWLAALLLVSVVYYVQWDLRTANTNAVALAAVLLALRAERRDAAAAGLWLALATATKLYAGVLAPWLLWRRRSRALLGYAAGMAGLFVVWPVAALGPGEATDLTRQWLERILDPGPALALPDYYKGLDRSLRLVLGGGSAPAWTGLLLAGLRGLWLLGVAALLWRTSHPGAGDRDRGFVGAAALLLLPLPFSPTFQAHHAVAVLPAAAYALRSALSPALAPGPRIAAGALLVAAAGLVKAVPEWPARSLAIHAALALYLAGLALPAPPLTPRDPPPA